MKRAAAIVGVALAGSQAGHLLAYELRYGATAAQVQSTGAHAYFPALVKTLLGGGALALIGALCLIGLARLAAGGKLEKQSAPSLLGLASILYTAQLAFFVVQETVEGGQAGTMVLWGLVAQLPVALVGALALRWLLARIAPALASLAHRVEPVLELPSLPPTPSPRPAPVAVAGYRAASAGPLTRRGPPHSF
jgi:hypothetical protein